jgi:hypothetical protein
MCYTLNFTKYLFAIAITGLIIQCTSQKNAASSTCYKARLEIKGMCANYTFKLLDGDIDTSKIVAAWTDENTGKQYTNVFGLGSPCNFPDSLKAGDEFYFTLDTAVQNCAVCMAYYPHPSKSLRLKVINGPCK